jgi:hypothetical protein
VFIEVTEALRCPRPHAESYLVCVPVAMDGRHVVRGGVGCPACGAEYPVVDGVLWFAPPGDAPASARASGPLTAETVETFLALEGAGGYVVVVGSAGRLAPQLAARFSAHIVAVNPPPGLPPHANCSRVHAPQALPVKRNSMRGAVVGAEASDAWLDAAVQAVLPGLRLIVEDERAAVPGTVELVRGVGILVTERRAR